MVPGTWRVVFSSTGDLAPARGAAISPLSDRMWVEAVRRPLRSVLDNIAAVLLPSDCRICGRSVVRLSRIPVCDHCLASLAPADVHACSVCGESLGWSAEAEDAALCGVGRRAHPHFDFALSFGAYDGALRRIVHLLKYEQLRPAANIIGANLAAAIAKRKLEGKTPILLVPVRLHRVKRRQRRFNQPEAIARGALRHLDRSRCEMHAGNLRRVRLGFTNGIGAASAPRKCARSFRGSTLNECARVLRRAGAKQVIVASVAGVYRRVMEIATGGMPNREKNAAAFVEAVAG